MGSTVNGDKLLHFSSLLGGVQLSRDLLSEICSAESLSISDGEKLWSISNQQVENFGLWLPSCDYGLQRSYNPLQSTEDIDALHVI
jgi:hypothetical protein